MNLFMEFTAFGDPVTQGSTKAYVVGGKARTVSKTPPLIEWRDIVRLAALDAMERYGISIQTGPAKVWMAFFLKRPQSAPKTRDVFPMATDLDKYVRAVNDAITNAGAWNDDSRVIDLHARKRYVVTPDLHRIYNAIEHRVQPCVEVKILWPDA